LIIDSDFKIIITMKNIEQKRKRLKGEEKIQIIRELGFSKRETIEYLFKHFTIETIQKRIRLLQSLGFTNPIALIEKFGPIAYLNVNRVIQFLLSLGFRNPISLIERFPQIVSLDLNRVKRRIQLIKRLNEKLQLQLDPIEIIENFPPYLGYDIKRAFFYLKIARFYNLNKSFYERLITKNPFIVFKILYELYSENKIFDVDEFIRLINKISTYSEETKQNSLDEIKTELAQIIEILRKKKDDPNAKFLLKLACYLEYLLKKERSKEINTHHLIFK